VILEVIIVVSFVLAMHVEEKAESVFKGKVRSLGYCEEDERGDEERKHKHEPRPKVKCFRDIVCLVARVLAGRGW
jgi:hypothetical protein